MPTISRRAAKIIAATSHPGELALRRRDSRRRIACQDQR
jgi:hypothetical protein